MLFDVLAEQGVVNLTTHRPSAEMLPNAISIQAPLSLDERLVTICGGPIFQALEAMNYPLGVPVGNLEHAIRNAGQSVSSQMADQIRLSYWLNLAADAENRIEAGENHTTPGADIYYDPRLLMRKMEQAEKYATDLRENHRQTYDRDLSPLSYTDTRAIIADLVVVDSPSSY
jgi:hypothetical protein